MASRISQQPVLPVVSPTDAPGRVSQEPVLPVVSPTDLKARVSQTPVEVVVSPTDLKARVSQGPVLVLQGSAGSIVSQAVVLVVVPNLGTGASFAAIAG